MVVKCLAGMLVALCVVLLYLRSAFSWKSRKLQIIPRDEKGVLSLLSIVASAGILLRIPYLFLFTAGDEEVFTYASWLTYLGEKPHISFFIDHPPLHMYLTSAVFSLFGVGIWQAKILSFTCSVLSIPLVYYLTDRIYGFRAALVSSSLFSLTGGVVMYTSTANNYSELVFLTLLALASLVKGIEEKNGLLIFTAGLSLGVASMFRLFGPLPLAAVAAVLLLRREVATVLTVLAGFLASFIPLLAYFHSPAFVYQVFIAHALYNSISITEKAYYLLTAVVPYFFPIIVLSVFGIMRGVRNNSAAGQIMLAYCLSTVAFVLLLNSTKTSLLLYFAYASIPLSIVAGNAADLIDRFRLDGWSASLLLLVVFLAPGLLMASDAFEWNESVQEAASYVAGHPGSTYIGDPAVAFMSGVRIPSRLFFLGKTEAYPINADDILSQPEGTIVATSESTFNIRRIKGLDNSTLKTNFTLIASNRYFEIFVKKQGG